MPTAPFLLGDQRLAERRRGLAHDHAVERALGIVLTRLVVEHQDDPAPYIQVSIIVVSQFGAADAITGEGQFAFDFRRRAEIEGKKSCPEWKRSVTPSRIKLQTVGWADSRRRKLERLEVRPVGADPLQAHPLEP